MQQIRPVVWVEIPRKYSLKLLNLADDCFLAEGKRKKPKQTSNKTEDLSQSRSLKCKFDGPQS